MYFNSTKLFLFTEYAEQDNPVGIFTVDVARLMLQDSRLHDLVGATQELQYVNLQLLKSREDRLCFYGNLLNLLHVHMVLQYLQKKFTEVGLFNNKK